MTKFELTDVDKAIQNRIKHFIDSELNHPSMMQNFQMTKIGSKAFLNSNYVPKHFESNLEIDAIIKCADYNFSLWHKMDPTKNYDITIYLLSVLGASYTVDDLMHENGIQKIVHPLAISHNEEGEIKSLIYLFNKYGSPRI